MKLKTLLTVFLLLNVVALSTYCYFFLAGRHAEQQAKLSDEEKYAATYEDAGVVSKADYIKIDEIGARVKVGHSISDADFDWLLELFYKPPFKDEPWAAPNKHVWTLAPMLDAKLTPAQKEKLYKAALSLLSSTDKTADHLDKVYGCNAMKKLRDKRAVSAILPLLSDPRPIVKQRAQQALDAINASAYTKAS